MTTCDPEPCALLFLSVQLDHVSAINCIETLTTERLRRIFRMIRLSFFSLHAVIQQLISTGCIIYIEGLFSAKAQWASIIKCIREVLRAHPSFDIAQRFCDAEAQFTNFEKRVQEFFRHS